VRGGYTGTPDPSPTNLYLRPTGVSREALLGSVSSGIYVTEMMGLHTVDTTTGDFSLGAVGAAIVDGRIGQAHDRMAISGNVIELLKSVEAVATDLTFLVAGGGSTILLRTSRPAGGCMSAGGRLAGRERPKVLPREELSKRLDTERARGRTVAMATACSTFCTSVVRYRGGETGGRHPHRRGQQRPLGAFPQGPGRRRPGGGAAEIVAAPGVDFVFV
jgi:hypothetical protein